MQIVTQQLTTIMAAMAARRILFTRQYQICTLLQFILQKRTEGK